MSIPKQIFQVNRFTNPEYITNKINKYINGWNFISFKDHSLIEYIINNPINELIDIKDNVNLIKNNLLKKEFFIYYYLYLNGGVYMSVNIMIKNDINIFLTDLSQCFIESCISKLIFDGFMATTPKNNIILSFLKQFYEMIIKNNNDEYVNIKNTFYKNILLSVNRDTELLNEKINSKNCKIFYKNDMHILTHYYYADINNKKHIYYSIENNRNFTKPNNNIKIGITLNIPKKALDLFCNGIKQNIFYLAELLLNIGYDCRFIVFNDELEAVDKKNLDHMMYDTRFKLTTYNNILYENFDIVIIMGVTLHTELIKVLKYMKTIVVAYLCGNSYIIDSEAILYNKKTYNNIQNILDDNTPIYDQVWSIPQMANTNLYYWKTIYRTDCLEVPFVWSSKGIEITQKIGNISDESFFIYNKTNTEKKIVICEPNISIMKWCLPCIFICENAYREFNNKDSINHVYVTNLMNKDIFNIDLFNKHINTLDLFKDKKLSKEYRYNILDFIKSNADICVSHTWENGLNYLYLDLAWMGWPIIHNGHLCKDVGYYYEQFNYEEGGKLLVDVIKTHDNNSKEYLDKNRKVIDRYLPSNKELQNKYETLIQSLINSYKDNFHLNIDYKLLTTKKVNPEIPLVIYQVWHSDELLDSLKYSIDLIKKSNPEFEHKLFNIDMCREFIKNNFEERILNAFDNIIPYAFKVDLWRYCILYLNGGVYLDSKYFPLNNFKFYWLTDKEYFCRDISSSFNGIYNALIICKPKNQLMFNAIYKVVDNVENKYYGSYSLEPTGPLMLKQLAINNNINIDKFELELEKTIDNEHFIKYNSLRILKIHKDYSDEQDNTGKYWIYYWVNKCAYK
jgi:mannosyltransferase OCH1-like enzyme